MKILRIIILLVLAVLLVTSPVVRTYLSIAIDNGSTFYGLAVLAVLLILAKSLWEAVKYRRAGYSTTLEASGHGIQGIVLCVLLMLVINSIAHCAG